MIEVISQYITERSDESLFTTTGCDRGLTEVTSQVFLLILAIGLIGGLAVTLGGVTDDILPGPEGNIEMQQNSGQLAITIDTLDSSASSVNVTVTKGDGNSDTPSAVSGDADGVSSEGSIHEVSFQNAEPGQTLIINDLEEGDIVNVVAHEEGSDRTNRIATTTIEGY